MYGINPQLLTQTRNDYSENLSDFAFKIDCSMGSNPYGSWPGLTCSDELLRQVDAYPHSEEALKAAIAAYVSSSPGDVRTSQVALACGSIGAVLALNRMVLKPGKVIIGIAPQFTAVVDDFVTYGADYQPVFLQPKDNYAFDLAAFLAAVRAQREAYIYLDNPNNPTGQVIALAAIEEIVKVAQAQDSFVLIDEAYGDYMAPEDSAINLVNRYDNLAIVRTFSKGFGAAGIRLGYIVAHERIIEVVGKVNIPFSMGNLNEAVAMALLTSGWAEETKRRVTIAKKMLLASLKTICVAATAETTPISLLYWPDETVDLCQVLEQTGLRAITGYGYGGLGINSVRLNVHADMPLLLQCLAEAEAILTSTTEGGYVDE